MSSALALASVTAVLKSLLENRLVEQSIAESLGDVSVTALPPDRVPIGADEKSQLNLFLYRVTPQTAWRGPQVAHRGSEALFRPLTLSVHSPPGPVAAPSRDGRRANKPSQDASPATTVVAQPPAEVPARVLGLELHYLLTAYGAEDLHAEILLGHAFQLLLETPSLSRSAIKVALDGSLTGGASPALRQVAAWSTLAEQVEHIEIAPEFINSDEASKLWSALQARYRPSATYSVSTVLVTGQL